MIRFFYLSLSFFFIACTVNNKENLANDSEDLKEDEIEHEIQSAANDKVLTKLDSLLADGLIIADSTEFCATNKFAVAPRTKLVINYPQGSKLIISEWENDISDKLSLLDFIVYNCLSNEILLESNYTMASYELIAIKPSLTIQIQADLPTPDGGLSRQPFLIKKFAELDSIIVVQNEVLFNPTKVDFANLDSAKQAFASRPILPEDHDHTISDFATEEFIILLFHGALNNDTTARQQFVNLNDKFVTDGATGELYSALLRLLNDL